MQNLGNLTIPDKHQKHKEKQESSTVIVNQPKTRHTTNRAVRSSIRTHRYMFIFILMGILAAWIYFIPPSNSMAVITFIVLTTSIFSLIASYFGQKMHTFSTIFVFSFLLMSYSIGFDIINTLVLLSFIIVLSTLFKTSKQK